MAEWTPESRDYLEGYLRQVSALARQQGDDADEILSELRGHIQREAEDAAGVMVTLDALRKTLSGIGTPEQVTGVEAALMPWREKLRAAEEKSPAPRTGQGVAAVPAPPSQVVRKPLCNERRNPMNRYEYKCVNIIGAGERTTRILNEYGKDGWELVTTCLTWHYFKRPLA